MSNLYDTDRYEQKSDSPTPHLRKSAASQGKMSRVKKTIIGAVAGVVIVVGICVGVFVANANNYEDKFLPHTSIQSVDVSGMTAQEAYEVVSGEFSSADTVLKEEGRPDVTINGEDIDLSGNFSDIEEILASQDKWDWLSRSFADENNYSIGIQYDEQKVIDLVSSLDAVSGADRKDPVNASVEYNEESGQFEAVGSSYGNKVDEGGLYTEISKSISNGGGTIDLAQLYTAPQIGDDAPEIVEAIEVGNKAINKKISYNIDMIDNAETLTKEQLVSFVKMGEDLVLDTDDDAIAAWLREMGQKYDTAGQAKSYTTAYGKQVALAGGTYGWITDEAAMLPIVKENILSADDEIDQDFVYQQEAAGPAGSGEWGSTYLDIDITEQKVRVIQDGEITHDFVCITGKPDGKHDSTEGEHKVVRIEKDFVMTGALNANGVPEYRTPCDYFVAWHSNGCALHDAPWQSWNTWTPSRYKTGYGSHGCANMRPQDAAVIYDIAYMGMPVLVHK